jgi:phosphoribosylformylglycinamidine cyclo-ligase
MNSKYEVNIDIANQAKAEMSESLKTDEKRVLNKIGAFASLYEFNFPEYKNPVLVMKTEEPGSKQYLAFKYNKIENICYDMINHLINDCIVMGARPLMVQDAIICGKLYKDVIKTIVKSISKCCNENGCVLTGGETSEQPGYLSDGSYVLTSSIIGVVEKQNIIDGSKIEINDVVIGVESSGLHTNGYTLIRKLITDNPKIETDEFINTIMEPHRCYYNAIKDLFYLNIINGLAHITGGGIKENLNRILPKNTDAIINLNSYQILDIFKFIKKAGNVSDEDMLRTFNMSIGLTIVSKNEHAQRIINHLKTHNINSYIIGSIEKGSKQVKTIGKLEW